MRPSAPLSMALLALLFGVAVAQMSIPMTRRAPYKAPFHMKGQSVNLRGGYINVGEYFATIQVGGQDVVVDVDTGSSTLAIPDANCDGSCPSSDPSYDSSRSHFFEKIQCGNAQCSSSFCYNDVRFRDQCSFGITYGDGSGLKGVAAKDRIVIGGYSGTAMFGRILHEVGSFSGPGQAPGILGVAYKSLNCAPCPAYSGYCNPPCYDTVLDRLHSDSGMPRKFGMCLTPDAGIWDLGFVDESKALTPIQYVPVVAGRNGYDYYTVNLHGTRAGSADLTILGGYQSQMTIVDSGTTLIIAPNVWLTSLKHAMVAAILPLANQLFSFDFYGSPPTVPMTDAQASQYPDLVFQFDNSVTVTLKWYHYLMDLNKDGQTRTVGMAGDNSNLFILGDIFMQAAYVVFDQETNRVGFAPLKPGTCGSSTGTGHTGRTVFGDASESQDWTLPIAGGLVGVVVALVAVAVVTAVRRRRSVAYAEVSAKAPVESHEHDLEAHHEGAKAPATEEPVAEPVAAQENPAAVPNEAEQIVPTETEEQQLIPAEAPAS